MVKVATLQSPAPYRRSSPLEAQGIVANATGYTKGDTWLGERNACAEKRLGIVNLRLDPSDKKAMSAVKKAVGIAPPTKPCTVAEGKGVRILWLAPDEWLIVSETVTGRRLALQIHEQAGPKIHLSAVNLTSNYATIRIAGPNANAMLGKMLPMDLHPAEFPAGEVRGTQAVKAQIFIHKLDEEPTYDIYVRRSFAAYVWEYLMDAGAEFEVKIAGMV